MPLPRSWLACSSRISRNTHRPWGAMSPRLGQKCWKRWPLVCSAMLPTFKLAMVQMRVDGGAQDANLARAEERIAEAAQHGADVVLLPEALTLGWTHPSSLTEAEPIPGGEACRRLAASANKHRLYVCAGLVERDGERVFNAAVLIDPRGKMLLHHRKINELEIGHPYYALGDRIQVARTPLATFGLMICADGFAKGQVISRSLALMGADVILSPS